jgi:hypothetical protein
MNPHSFVVPYVFSSPIASSTLPAHFLNFPEKGVRVFKKRGRVRVNP